jgi:hypothetical protein
MSATALFTYIWHYLVARLLYEEILRPLFAGRPYGFFALGAITVGIFAAFRSRRR